MSKKNKRVVIEPLNLTKTQNGYVPLEARFKSFPPDSLKSPKSDSQFYFENRANSTLEHSTIDLLFPTPAWLRKLLPKRGLVGSYLTTGDGKLLVVNNKYLVGTQKA